jgi:hypothetical protein
MNKIICPWVSREAFTPEQKYIGNKMVIEIQIP